MNVRLIVRKSANKNGLSLVQVRYTHQSLNFHHSTGISVDINNWNPQTESVRKSMRGFTSLNTLLLSKKQEILDIAHKILIGGEEPDVETVKAELLGLSIKKEIPSFLDFIKQFIIESEADKSPATVRGYNVTLKHLQQYEVYKNLKIDYDSIDMNFYHSFLRYLYKTCNNNQNGASSKFKHIKLFMLHSLDRGYHSNVIFRSKRFKVPSNETEHVFLTDEEIQVLIQMDLSTNKAYQKVRDLLCTACLTGLRYSDIVTINSENDRGDYLHINTVKTNQPLIIPIHRDFRTILNKYKISDEEIRFPNMSNQQLNKRIKILAEMAGINQTITMKKDVGGKKIEVSGKKSSFLSSHSGRRSFITNEIIRGTDVNVLRLITGHKTTVIQKYIRVKEAQGKSVV